ncbi:hypothetical protein [Parasitella parasitica]|uniref:Guanine nucleotide-binding protein alpha-16 subunit n=1 Tax=Parasitella parasitica TaxID=35722 RepID=A0A0B7NI14_9FUNG|nr:hypothetical protein [Parasitella parasitica]
MGCCASVEERDSAGKLRNEEIEGQLRMEKMNSKNEVKLLLLGAGESGKSTILKQMKLIHDGGFTQEEKEAYKEIIFSNSIQSMYVLLEAMDTLGISLSDASNQMSFDYIMNQCQKTDYPSMSPESVRAIKLLWQDIGIQAAYARRNEFQLNDSASYYFDSIERIGEPDYFPTDQDVLRSRVKTTGIAESKFMFGTLTYRMFDVGGQRSERKKWIHCFEDVTAIIFLVAISEYDQVLIEDESVNRMQEALTLFDSICNSRWFERTSTILFLNKTDLFKQKLPKSPLVDYFPDYQGANDDYEKASSYLMQRFISLNGSTQKQVYTHLTCATDTEQVKFVMTAVNDIILQTNLRDVVFCLAVICTFSVALKMLYAMSPVGQRLAFYLKTLELSSTYLFDYVRRNADRGRSSLEIKLEKPIMAILLASFLSRLLVVALVEIRLGHLGLKQTTATGMLLTLPSLICICFVVR